MPKYLIERNVPGVGKMGPDELRALSQKSNDVLQELTGDGKRIQWVESFVSDDAIHCVYYASGPDVIREHARCGGFPCDNITEVRGMINPTTGE